MWFSFFINHVPQRYVEEGGGGRARVRLLHLGANMMNDDDDGAPPHPY